MENSVGLKIWQGINHYENDIQFVSPMKKLLRIQRILKQFNIEFIRWFHELSATTNLQIFRETEFVYSSVDVNNNIHFHRKKIVDS